LHLPEKKVGLKGGGGTDSIGEKRKGHRRGTKEHDKLGLHKKKSQTGKKGKKVHKYGKGERGKVVTASHRSKKKRQTFVLLGKKKKKNGRL